MEKVGRRGTRDIPWAEIPTGRYEVGWGIDKPGESEMGEGIPATEVLPELFSLTSVADNKYVRYMPENGEFKKILLTTGEDAMSPYALFHVEPSKKHDGYIHIRCGYNKMYWVPKNVGDDVWVIFGDASEPVEDLSLPSCTLFQILSDPYTPGFYWFTHAYFKSTRICKAVNPTKSELKGCLLTGKMNDLSKDILNGFYFTDMGQRIALPTHVCFKGDNGKYLSAQHIEGHPYLQFSSDDPGDQTVRHTLQVRQDGTIRIKSDHFGLFWRLSPAWIWADSGDTAGYDGADTRFQVLKIGDDTFALKNLGNNKFCKRLTTEGKTDCLNAAVDSISSTAKLQIIELVMSRRVYNIDCHLEDARVYDRKMLTMATAHAVNRSSTENTAKLTVKYGATKENRWDANFSLKFGVETTIKAGIPIVGEAEIKIQYEFSGSYTWGETNTSTEEQSIEYEIKVPPNTLVTLSVLPVQAKCDIPFSYYQKDILSNGETVVHKLEDGIYHGVNSYDFTYDVKEEQLDKLRSRAALTGGNELLPMFQVVSWMMNEKIELYSLLCPRSKRNTNNVKLKL